MVEYFPQDYFSGRRRFRELALAAGAAQGTYDLDAKGPSDEFLTIDSAYLGPERPPLLVILSSGTHGIEGYTGSALQQLFLNEFARQFPRDRIGVLLVHAVNPYGFAHRRRANENNVDLNRNALDRFPGPENTAYRELDSWLNPSHAPWWIDDFYLKGVRYVLSRGLAPVKQAIAGGQYHNAKGIFFGGESQQQSLTLLRQLLMPFAQDSLQSVIHIDIHTGLGRRGDYQLLVDFPRNDPRFEQLQHWFGEHRLETNQPENTIAYQVEGSLARLTRQVFNKTEVYTAVLEFGTLPIARVVHRLIRENQLFFHGIRGSLKGRWVQREFDDTFCPRNDGWRNQVLQHGRNLMLRLLILARQFGKQ